jgi:hypothetical protein
LKDVGSTCELVCQACGGVSGPAQTGVAKARQRVAGEPQQPGGRVR